MLKYHYVIAKESSNNVRSTTEAIPVLQRAQFVGWGLLRAARNANASARKDEHNLKSTFSFNVRLWKKEFEAEKSHYPRNTSDQEAFMIFGKHRIEPLLNEILRRKRYPTWIGLLSFVLKDKIDKRSKRDAYYKNRYQQKTK